VCYQAKLAESRCQGSKLPGGQTPVGDCCIQQGGVYGLHAMSSLGRTEMPKSSAGAVFKVFSGQEALQRFEFRRNSTMDVCKT
jgi:hypothetical protein